MKKGTIILLILVLSLMIGYALFSDQLIINGTATAQGNFEVTAECEPGLSLETGQTVSSIINVLNKVDSYPTVESGYENDICEVDGKVVNYSVNFKYPTAMRLFTVKITNTGTIDAKLDEEKVENIILTDKREGSEGESDIHGLLAAYIKDGVNYMYNENITDDSFILPVGKSVYMVFLLEWFENNRNDNKFQEYSESYTIPFIQATE